MKRSWFEVSKEGLRELQGTKPKWKLIGELIQNAFDEPITYCKVKLDYRNNYLIIEVEDDSPIGFRELSDAYTLFGSTYKRKDPEKRGRFNIGEKTVLSICDAAIVSTTMGTIIFDKRGRRKLPRRKTKRGSVIQLNIRSKRKEVDEIKFWLQKFIPPKSVCFEINNQKVTSPKEYKRFSANLTTEIYDERTKVMKRSARKTAVAIYKKDSEDAYLYEMGIPIQKIESKYHLDIQQKVPLTVDRQLVSPGFLQDLFAEVLNVVADGIRPEEASNSWVRTALSDPRVSDDTVKSIVHTKWGDKVVVPDPSDPKSVDEAKTRGYKVVNGPELSKDEWEQIKRSEAIPSSSKLFGRPTTDYESIPEDKWTEDQKIVAAYAKMIARETVGKQISVNIIKSKATEGADYGNRVLTFNHSQLGKKWWGGRVCELSLIHI